MPDLHLDAVHAFWDAYDRRTLYRVIVGIERVETWALDAHPAVEAALIRLGEAIDKSPGFQLTEEAKLIRVLISIHAGRALRLLQSLDIITPGIASDVLMFADELVKSNTDPYAELFLRRNMVFERLQLLSRVFAPQRVSLVLKALEQHSE